ncbi:ATP-grasp domain protein [Aspergillus parasiticus SU-1]|uniref:ATP-grasp domain protein n=1 Tax=Aspergillus parasiticus (strain ATCC 56775 / NRRL 5862 / SRRC 143 / SU-1) TaxID=1403190 RepID=A0A0F0HXU4_ASPPU|nr:ATP-grasp domain protein [Aspergillus parasiticus SU-1]
MKVVELDTTVAELHTTHGVEWPLAVDLYHTYTHLDLHDHFRRETRFVEDEDPEVYYKGDANFERFRQWALCFKTIRFLPMVGPGLVLLHVPQNFRNNIERALSQFPERQRPIVQYIDLDTSNFEVDRQSALEGRKLVYWRPKSWMSKESCLVAPEVSYELNDKRFLSHPGIPTPTMEIIQLAQPKQQEYLARRPLPFVVKFCRCSSGQGTFIVTTEEARHQMLDALSRYVTRGGEEVQLSELVRSKRPHYGVNFFVDDNETTEPEFLGATEQVSTQDGVWVGGIIDYNEQGDLERALRDTISAVAHTLRQSTYIGWVGIDVIFDHHDRPLVVDLNARMAGGIALSLFSKHFLSLGLPLAQVDTVSFAGPASRIYDILSAEIESGQIIVTLAMEISDADSMASVVFGGQTRDDLITTHQWIQDRLLTSLN